LRAETSSRCVLLRHEGGKTTLVDAARPGPHFKATVRSLLRHMKAKVRASDKRKRVALYLRDRDEAGLRVVMSPLGLGRVLTARRSSSPPDPARRKLVAEHITWRARP
jgi:hypothetical protein